MRLHLIRHGQTDWNAIRRVQGHADSALNATGLEQARQLATAMEQYPIRHVYCSSSLRTRQTAAQVFGHRNLAHTFLDGLREIHLGPWEGQLYSELELQQPEQFRHFFHAPHLFQVPGAETYAQLQQRGMDTLQWILAQEKARGAPGEAAVVSHGAMIKSILNRLQDKPLAELWEPPLMHNCSHTIIQFNGSDADIIKYV